jgi:hypothetical protein
MASRASSVKGAYAAVPPRDGDFAQMGDESSTKSFSPRMKLYSGIFAGIVAVAVVVTLGVTLSKQFSPPPAAAKPNSCNYAGYRLQGVASPDSQSVYLRPEFTAPFTFSGSTNISITLNAGVQCLQLHATALEITSASVNDEAIETWTYDTTNQRVILSLPHSYASGESLLLSIDFQGFLGTNNHGLYLSTYTDDAGDTINVVGELLHM